MLCTQAADNAIDLIIGISLNNDQWFDIIIMVNVHVHSRTMLHPRSKTLHLLMCSCVYSKGNNTYNINFSVHVQCHDHTENDQYEHDTKH